MSQVKLQVAIAQLATCTGVRLADLSNAIETINAGIGEWGSLDAALTHDLTGSQQTIVNVLNRLQQGITDLPDNEQALAIANSAIEAWVGAAPGAFDSLEEIGAYLANNSDTVTAIFSALAKRVRVDEVQNLSETEEAMGRFNIKALGVVEGQAAIDAAKQAAIDAAALALDARADAIETVNADQAYILELLSAANPAPGALGALGVTDASTVLTTAYLANVATAAYQAGSPAGTQVANAIRDTTFNADTTPVATSFNLADKGVLTLKVNGAAIETYDLGANFDATKRTTTQTLPTLTGAMKLTAWGVYNSIHTRASVRVNVTSALLRDGDNFLEITHTGTGTADQTTGEFHFWWDKAPVALAISGQSLGLKDETNTVTLSGVKYATTGSVLKLNVTAAGVASNTYNPANPVVASAIPGVATTTVAMSDTSVTGLSPTPINTETMVVTDKEVAVAVAGAATEAAGGTLVIRNGFANTTAAIPASPVMIWTDTTVDTDSVWNFSGESRRIPVGTDLSAAAAATMPLTGNYNSAATNLTAEAQVGVLSNGVTGLKLKRTNYVGKQPANTADYSGFTGTEGASRLFVAPAAAGNCRIVLHGVTKAPSIVGGGSYNVRIAVPGQTAWLDVGAGEDTLQLSSVENAGAAYAVPVIAGGNTTLYVSFKGKNVISSNLRMGFEIKLNDATVQPSKIEVQWS